MQEDSGDRGQEMDIARYSSLSPWIVEGRETQVRLEAKSPRTEGGSRALGGPCWIDYKAGSETDRTDT